MTMSTLGTIGEYDAAPTPAGGVRDARRNYSDGINGDLTRVSRGFAGEYCVCPPSQAISTITRERARLVPFKSWKR